MKTSTTKSSALPTVIAAAFWLVVWQVLSLIIGRELLLPSPISVLSALISLAGQSFFWVTVATTVGKIFAGFVIAVIVGVMLAVLSHAFPLANTLTGTLLAAIKAVPVASFTIIALVWVKSAYLSVLVSFLMSLPVIYFNTLTGIDEVEVKLLEMAQAFSVSLGKRIRFIYASMVTPYFLTGVTVALSFAWKSGVAAEVIGHPKNSVGLNMYNAKVYLEIPNLFAWTAVVVVVSIIIEGVIVRLIKGRRADD